MTTHILLLATATAGLIVGFILGMYFEFKNGKELDSITRLTESEIHLITLEIEKLRSKSLFLHDAILNQFQKFLANKNQDFADIKGELALIISKVKNSL